MTASCLHPDISRGSVDDPEGGAGDVQCSKKATYFGRSVF